MPESEQLKTDGGTRDNTVLRRFEMDAGGATAFANYRLGEGTVIITHTETPRNLRGQGIASQLVRGAFELIQARGQKVVARCSFVANYLEKHPEWRKLEA